MSSRALLLTVGVLVCALLIISCGPGLPTCKPGSEQACACPGGSTGSQLCTRESDLDGCRCPPPGPPDDKPVLVPIPDSLAAKCPLNDPLTGVPESIDGALKQIEGSWLLCWGSAPDPSFLGMAFSAGTWSGLGGSFESPKHSPREGQYSIGLPPSLGLGGDLPMLVLTLDEEGRPFRSLTLEFLSIPAPSGPLDAILISTISSDGVYLRQEETGL